jgi:exopolysaccharide biosynthesis polyprenyl glycosylphosphotransferase
MDAVSLTPVPNRLRTPSRRRVIVGRWLALGDTLTIATATLAAYALRTELGQSALVRPFANEVPAAFALIPSWLLVFYLVGAYRPEYLNSGGDAFRRFTAGVGVGVLSVGFASFVLDLSLSRLFVAFLAALVFCLGGFLRVAVRRYLHSSYAEGRHIQRALVVGTDPDARDFVAALRSAPGSGYQVVGYLDEEASSRTMIDGLPVLGSPEELAAICDDQSAGLVVVSPSGVTSGTLRDVTVALEGSPVDLAVTPSLFQVVTRRMTIETVAGIPLLHVHQIRLERGKAAVKRALDLAVATCLLILATPVLFAASIAIWATSSGPILFRQERVGREGRPFEILKFRTMVDDAEERFPDVAHLNDAGGHFFKIARDPRITPVGRHLRRWSIDELPQLVNVLRGDMSMVGPRPPLPGEVAAYEPWHLRRLRVRPGITGVWQVSGRSEVAFDEAVRLDLFYIENWSLGYDLFILAKTVRAVLSRQGAW